MTKEERKLKVLEEINHIFIVLESKKWSEHSEDLFMSSQGKLAVYLASLSAMVADAEYAHEILKLNCEETENQQYLLHKNSDKTEGEARTRAKLTTSDQKRIVLEAKKEYSEIKGIWRAVESLITAIQVQLRNINREISTAKFQNQ